MPDTSQDPFAVESPPAVQIDPTKVQPVQPPTEAEVQAALSDFAASMFNYDTTTLTTAQVRQQLLTKLLPAALEMDLSVTDKTDPDLYASQTRMVSEVRQLLNDMDSSAQKHVVTKLKQKDQELNEQNSINAAELLKHIQIGVAMNQIPQPKQEDIDQAIAEQFKERGCLVLETELIENDSQLPEAKVSDEL